MVSFDSRIFPTTFRHMKKGHRPKCATCDHSYEKGEDESNHRCPDALGSGPPDETALRGARKCPQSRKVRFVHPICFKYPCTST